MRCRRFRGGRSGRSDCRGSWYKSWRHHHRLWSSHNSHPATKWRSSHFILKHFILELIIFTKLLNHGLNWRIRHFRLTYINSLDIFFELYRAMNLNFLISSNNIRGNFIRFASIEGCFQLMIRQFVQDMVAELESPDRGRWATWIHISHCASVSHMLFQQEVRLSVTRASSNPFWIIGEVDCPIFYPFKRGCRVMLAIEHSIFPVSPSASAERTRRHSGLELISIVSVLDKELHMIVSMHMNDDGRIVYNVVMQILEIFSFEAQALDSLN